MTNTRTRVWPDGIPDWARDHDGRMSDSVAARAVIEELAAAVGGRTAQAELIDHVASQWDGCIYDAGPSGDIDIGEAIRAAAKRTLPALALRVWHVPQVGVVGPFYTPVESPTEAKKVISLLAKYDDFQYKQNIKPDYASVSGLEVFEDGEWCEWNDDVGQDIHEWSPA